MVIFDRSGDTWVKKVLKRGKCRQFRAKNCHFNGFGCVSMSKIPSNALKFLIFQPVTPYSGPLKTSETLLQCINFVFQCIASMERMTYEMSNVFVVITLAPNSYPSVVLKFDGVKICIFSQNGENNPKN